MSKNTTEKYIPNTLEYLLYNRYYAILLAMRYTVDDFKKDFPDDDACLEAVFQERYGHVDTCPGCGVIGTKFHRIKGRKTYSCQWCGYQLSPLAQTIFHKSSTSLWKWFYAMYLFSVSKNGVAAKELERHLGVTYKTAHRMARQIRSLMYDGDLKLGGNVEADETYIGGVARLNKKFKNKTPILGVVERGGNVKAIAVTGANASTALPFLRSSVEENSAIITDDSRIYNRLKREYPHERVNHSAKEYVRGIIHTNTIEGFWGQLKRSIDGTYHVVSRKYLQLYVNEFVFRYNLRGAVVYPVLLERACLPLRLTA